ncbi:MAG: alpha/beta hydrolase [Candidatus Hydrogenedentes bacterium]|nr:alpha/beta hydrolase [Candidatus Hydrogenedentota bacterium]
MKSPTYATQNESGRPITLLVRGKAQPAKTFAILLILAVGVLGCPPGTLPGNTVAVTHDVEYGLGYVDEAGKGSPSLEPLLMDVYTPENAEGLRPAAIIMHGGGFVEGDKADERIVDFATYFAARGFVCFAINYRLIQDNPPASDLWGALLFPSAVHAAIVDAKAAVRHVRKHAGEYGVDANRIAFIGESAGAIAGAAVAVTDAGDYAADGEGYPIPSENAPNASPRVQAYVHLWGNADHVLGEITRDDPPTMIVHGEEDDVFLTPFAVAERFHLFLELQGVPHEFYAAENFGHAAWNYRLRGKSLERLTLDFLNEHLFGVKTSHLMESSPNTGKWSDG